MMQSAMGLASIFGPYLLLMGLWMLFYHDNVTKVCTSLKNNPATFCLGGMINLIIGLAVLSQYNVWMWNLAVLVTLFGWWQLVRGVMVLFFPQVLMKCSTGGGSYAKGKGLIPLVWGVLLCYMAFFAH
ncbi:MAG: hypothetical protein JSS61_07460 [Verrucomicrobia bacterium]|nr:hypothetical protein [Verrucomicrobiota bacterium]